MQTLTMATARSDDGSLEPWVERWFEPWAQALRVGLVDGRDDPPMWHPEERLASLRRPSSSFATAVVAAVHSDEVLGGARLLLPRRDNTTLAMVELAVEPRHRRRGVARALLREVREQASAAGRTSLLTEVDCPLDADESWPGARFARAAGMTMRLGDVRRELPLPVEETLWRRLREEAAPHLGGYRLRSWAGPAAAADLPALAALLARMSTDAPMGELEYQPETWDADRVLDEEARYTAQGYRWWTVLAETAAGEPAGFTRMGYSHRKPQRLWQWDTLVVREHRGHRIGLAMKLVAVDAAAAAEPTAMSVTTWNAASNTPMISVNEAMGFRAVEATQEWQGPV